MNKPVDLLIRGEWAFVAIVSVIAYAMIGQSWLLFFALALAPDLFILGYLAGPRVGANTYNLAHLLFWPALLIAFGLWQGSDIANALGLIWLTHIAVDRALGYGLKLPTAFADTHLGRIGRDPSR